MQWSATLGGMRDHGTSVKWWCQVCDRTQEIEVAAWCRIVGEDFSLWNVYVPCCFDGCDDGIMKAHAAPGKATPYIPLSHYMAMADGKGGFDFMRKFPVTPPWSWGIEEWPSPIRSSSPSGRCG